MHLVEAVAVRIAGVLTPAVADRLMAIAPLRQSGIDVVLVGVNLGARAMVAKINGQMVFC